LEQAGRCPDVRVYDAASISSNNLPNRFDGERFLLEPGVGFQRVIDEGLVTDAAPIRLFPETPENLVVEINRDPGLARRGHGRAAAPLRKVIDLLLIARRSFGADLRA